MSKNKISSVKDAEKIVEGQSGIISSLIQQLKDNNKVNYKKSQEPSFPKFLQSKQFKQNIDTTKDNFERIESNVPSKSSPKESASKILGSIYKLMKKNREEYVRESELQKTKKNKEAKEEDKMHEELVSPLQELGEKKPGIPGKVSVKKPSKPKEKEIKSKSSTIKRRKRRAKGKLSITGAIGAASVLGVGKSALASETSIPLTGGLAKIASATIAKEEGLPKGGKAYWDPPGQSQKVSVGYGHQIKEQEYKQGFIQAGDEQIPIKGNKGIDTVMTADQAQKLLQNDLPKYVDAAQKPLGSSWQKLADPQKAALVSYAYNTGSTVSLVKAGIKEPIESGDTKGAAEIIRDKGIKTAGGRFVPVLAARRNKEAMMFASADMKGSEATPISDTPKNAEVASISDTNKNLKDDMSAQKGQQVAMINNTVINSVNNQSSSTPKSSKEEDKPAYLRKSYG